MRLHLLRHGEAVPRQDPSVERDAERPLTERGREQIRRVAEATADLGVDPDRVLASPYARARQTAKTVAEAFEGVETGELHELRPKADPADTRQALTGIRDAEEVVLCGHRPHLPKLTSYLLTGEAEGLDVDFPKASLVTIDIALLTPEALGRLERHLPFEAFAREA
jgi:phosphohistidine phosphatase